jgi:hypothetical protein
MGHYKSGYRRLAKIYIIGVGSRVYARLGKSLQGMGIKRIKSRETRPAAQDAHTEYDRGTWAALRR